MIIVQHVVRFSFYVKGTQVKDPISKHACFLFIFCADIHLRLLLINISFDHGKGGGVEDKAAV